MEFEEQPIAGQCRVQKASKTRGYDKHKLYGFACARLLGAV